MFYQPQLISGTNVKHIYNGNLKTLHYALAPLPEQQKIAEILSTVDEQISTTQAIIDKSKELKKGLMQKLFSEGIEHTEFKDTKIGRIPMDWEVVKYGEIAEIISGFGFKKEDYSDEGYKLLRIDNVSYGKIIWNNLAYINVFYILFCSEIICWF
jgi:type I restriction enzyme S subunit